MVKKVASQLKKWLFRTNPEAPGYRFSSQEGRKAHDNPVDGTTPNRSANPGNLDEDTANEVVATWNVLNPP